MLEKQKLKIKLLKTKAEKPLSYGNVQSFDSKQPFFQPFGCMTDFFYDKSPAIVISGPAGTGKSRGALEKYHLLLQHYAGSKGLMTRKTRQSMTHTCIETFNSFVIQDKNTCHFKPSDQAYHYSNGSKFVTLGLDDPINIMSGEYDFIYVQEGTQIPLQTYAQLITRLRWNRIPYQQITLDVNPGDPNHWIMQQVKAEKLKIYWSWHEDNPVYFNQKERVWTDLGKAYIARLDMLPDGALKQRLRYGIWASAEGAVYPQFDQEIHVISRPKVLPKGLRIWVVDFGYNDPFVWQEWLDCDNGDLILLRQYYHTKKTVHEAAAEIKAASLNEKGEIIKPYAIICDHDAEGRAQLEIEWDMMTLPAFKSIRVGIQAVQMRLKAKKVFFCEDSLIHDPDPELVFYHKPDKTEDEFTSYTYEQDPKPNKVEVPVDKFNHGMDCIRYVVGFVDNLSIDMSEIDITVALDDDSEVRISPV